MLRVEEQEGLATTNPILSESCLAGMGAVTLTVVLCSVAWLNSRLVWLIRFQQSLHSAPEKYTFYSSCAAPTVDFQLSVSQYSQLEQYRKLL